jgi:hypothetical protein
MTLKTKDIIYDVPKATTPVKRSPWSRASIPVNPDPNALPCKSIKDIFNEYIEKNHKLTDLQKKELFKKVANRIYEMPGLNVETLIEEYLTK